MYLYSAYGQVVASTLELPELAAAASCSPSAERNADPAITITEQPVAVDWSAMAPSESMRCTYAVHPDGDVYLAWDGIGKFRVSGGRKISFEPAQGVDAGLLRVVTLGSVMAVLLNQQGVTVLHGSSVVIAGRAAAFVGGKGYGKSTLAAALVGRGHLLLTDDLIAVRPSGFGYEVLPSYCQLKLWPDAAEALGHSAQALPKVTEVYDKVALRSHDAAASSVELGPIFALAIEPKMAVTKLSGQAAMLQLLAHSYINRFNGAINGARSATQLSELSRLAQSVGVYTLARPAGLERLSAAAEQLERFMAEYPA